MKRKLQIEQQQEQQSIYIYNRVNKVRGRHVAFSWRRVLLSRPVNIAQNKNKYRKRPNFALTPGSF